MSSAAVLAPVLAPPYLFPVSLPVRRRTVRPRHYLMCRPVFFDIRHTVSPWDPPERVDTLRAVRQWQRLYEMYRSLGHTVDLIEPVPGRPDMVFTAHAATIMDGHVLLARPHPAGQAPTTRPHPAAGQQTDTARTAHKAWFQAAGYAEPYEARQFNDGQRDFLVTDYWILAGRDEGSSPDAHREAQDVLKRPLISLELADPRFHHLDTALTVLDGNEVMYHPQAFTPRSREVLEGLFPDALLVGPEDADALGLNAVSDGLHVFLPDVAHTLAEQLRARGYVPVGVDLSELMKADGGVKSCTLELKP
ncbi:dimethylargininase [Streptomyces sp. NPDC059009]|uniref:dimethylargininase n=1 Tax=Streptomyces sp. NPDC059009 TaxID=3346694 RepID=UPI003673E490